MLLATPSLHQIRFFSTYLCLAHFSTCWSPQSTVRTFDCTHYPFTRYQTRGTTTLHLDYREFKFGFNISTPFSAVSSLVIHFLPVMKGFAAKPNTVPFWWNFHDIPHIMPADFCTLAFNSLFTTVCLHCVFRFVFSFNPQSLFYFSCWLSFPFQPFLGLSFTLHPFLILCESTRWCSTLGPSFEALAYAKPTQVPDSGVFNSSTYCLFLQLLGRCKPSMRLRIGVQWHRPTLDWLLLQTLPHGQSVMWSDRASGLHSAFAILSSLLFLVFILIFYSLLYGHGRTRSASRYVYLINHSSLFYKVSEPSHLTFCLVLCV